MPDPSALHALHAPRSLFLVNRLDELVPKMTTAMLIEAAVRRGHRVWVCGVADMGLSLEAEPVAGAVEAVGPAAARGDDEARRGWLGRLAEAEPQTVPLASFDLLILRTNPARDQARAGLHNLALQLAWLAADRGLRVVNHPAGLARASSKLFLARLPAFARPSGMVSSDAARLRAFVESRERGSVLKPLAGTRGAGVFRLAPGDANLGVILEGLLAEGPVLAQDWVAGAEEGDMRVLMLDGEPLRVESQLAAIRRVPASGDFRSNLHAGGRAEPATLSEEQERTLAAVGPLLRSEGIRLAGVDLIGDRVIELNVYSSGGLRDAERFSGQDFCDAILADFESSEPTI